MRLRTRVRKVRRCNAIHTPGHTTGNNSGEQANQTAKISCQRRHKGLSHPTRSLFWVITESSDQNIRMIAARM